MTAPDGFDAQDRALTARMRQFFGHIEDMADTERVFMLGALTGALERRLPAAGAVKDPEADDFVRLSGRIISVNAGTAMVEVYRSDPAGLRVTVQCGALDHVDAAADDDMAEGGTA